ncbi:MAG: hypothetical protein IPN07_18110 [Dehalococcoidia bacterium]|nr:hypothetical protein [Dehalococcoidia bacterium]
MTFCAGARVISVNPSPRASGSKYLMPILAHEAVHCDDEDGIVEEVAATAFDGFLYLQLVAVDPELAQARTRVARELNIDAVALINSGQRYPESIRRCPQPRRRCRAPADEQCLEVVRGTGGERVPGLAQRADPRGNRGDGLHEPPRRGRRGSRPKSPFDLVYLDELLSWAVDGGVFANAILAFDLVPEW